jgi:hypothetical protein
MPFIFLFKYKLNVGPKLVLDLLSSLVIEIKSGFKGKKLDKKTY